LYSTGRFKDSLKVKKDVSARYGFRTFWMGRVNVEGPIYFSPEVGYTFKGFTVKQPEAGIAEQEVLLHYFDILLLQEYIVNEKFFIKVGPSLSGALFGKLKKISTTGLRSNEDIPFNFAAWSRFEAAIHLGVGVHFGNGWVGELRLSDGLSNLFDGDGGPNIKTRFVGIQVGKYLR
jgi:Outer membrane protein beta-barrel domain